MCPSCSDNLKINKIASQRKTHAPRFLYLRETKSWWCEKGEEGEEEKVHLLTHTTARGVGKNTNDKSFSLIDGLFLSDDLIYKCQISQNISLFQLQSSLPELKRI